MPKEYLGEFEELILTMVGALQEDAYGAAIADEIESRLKCEVNLSAVHVTLYRLEGKGHSDLTYDQHYPNHERICCLGCWGYQLLRPHNEQRRLV